MNANNTPSTMNANEINEALAMLVTLDATQIRVAAAVLVSPKHFDEHITPETAKVGYLRMMLEDAITEHDITAAQLNEAASRRPRIFKPPHAAICPLDFDTVFDAYNYAMAHRHDENPLAVAIPTDVHGTDYGRSLALNGVKLFAVWSDELEETANGYVYTTEAGAREAMAQVEENDKEAGVYEPDYWKVSDMTKYFA